MDNTNSYSHKPKKRREQKRHREELKVTTARKPTSRVIDVHSAETNRLLTIAQLSDLAVAKLRYAGGPDEMQHLVAWGKVLQALEPELNRLCEAAGMPLAK